MTTEKLTFTVEEAGKLLGISRALAYQMVHTGQLPTLRFGKRLVVPKKAVQDMLEKAPTAN
ncbi:MAG: helix-turn-helix domain-containing protein [Dehalococcoidia bacterium]|jgi:excisionase family DNA binding protein|nr:helix-turn-helix domain-containing protein [Dehalococcoidia bacterium]